VIPIVVLQSTPDYCDLCKADRWMRLHPIRNGAATAASTPVRCPHCTNTADLHSLIGITTTGAPR
jgi:hypothetical protein